MGALINMKSSAEEAQEWAQPTPGDAPEYPYGLTIQLDDDSLAKLGITSLPKVGTKMTLQATVEVCSTSQYSDRKGEAESSLSLQITDMALNGGTTEESAAEKLFGQAVGGSLGLLD